MKLADLVPVTPRALGVLRAAVFGVLALHLALIDFSAIGRLPVTLMHPPGVMEYLGWKFFARLLTPGGMLAFKFALVGSLTASAVGLFTAASTKLAAGLYLLFQGVLRSFGHFNHDEACAIWCLVILAFVPCGHGFSLDARRRGPIAPEPPAAYGYPILLMRCVLAWTYFSAGVLKLRIAGLAFFTPESFLTLAQSTSLGNDYDTQFCLAFALDEYRALVGPAMVVAVAWELAFPLAVVSRRLRPFILGFGVAFHVSTLLLMNITFPVQLAMYLVFVDWGRFAGRAFRDHEPCP